MWADSFDSADGQLARITGKYSRIGRILDGLSGDFVVRRHLYCHLFQGECHLAILHGSPVGDMDSGGGGWCLSRFCRPRRPRLLPSVSPLFVNGKNGSELENTGDLRERFRSLSWRRNFVDKVVLGFYLQYSIGQGEPYSLDGQVPEPVARAVRRQHPLRGCAMNSERSLPL